MLKRFRQVLRSPRFYVPALTGAIVGSFLGYMASQAHTERPRPIERGIASWFSLEACHTNPYPDCPTKSGLPLPMLEDYGISFGASWKYDLGTWVLVCKADTTRCTPVCILDRGPAKRLVEEGRIIDLSRVSFKAIGGNFEKGLIEVEVYKI